LVVFFLKCATFFFVFWSPTSRPQFVRYLECKFVSTHTLFRPNRPLAISPSFPFTMFFGYLPDTPPVSSPSSTLCLNPPPPLTGFSLLPCTRPLFFKNLCGGMFPPLVVLTVFGIPNLHPYPELSGSGENSFFFFPHPKNTFSFSRDDQFQFPPPCPSSPCPGIYTCVFSPTFPALPPTPCRMSFDRPVF